MHRLRRILVHELVLMTAIGCSSLACQQVREQPGSAPELYVADDIDVETGTIHGRQISSLTEVEVRLRGLVRSKSNGSTIVYLSHDKNAFDPDSYRNCINLVIDKKLNFKSPVVRDFVFKGKFLLVDRLDPSFVHLTYNGIGFDTDCQVFKKPNQYPYFIVNGFSKYH